MGVQLSHVKSSVCMLAECLRGCEANAYPKPSNVSVKYFEVVVIAGDAKEARYGSK